MWVHTSWDGKELHNAPVLVLLGSSPVIKLVPKLKLLLHCEFDQRARAVRGLCIRLLQLRWQLNKRKVCNIIAHVLDDFDARLATTVIHDLGR